tara:strand:- start:2142 stop:2327 length:186 start_codon:yes stop_codon:yes gene_type:complete
MTADEKRWQAEQDLRTLIEAGKVLADPKRQKAAMREKRKQQRALSELDNNNNENGKQANGT